MQSLRTGTAEIVGERVIYLDTSAAMKLVRPEAQSADLSRWLRKRHGIPVVSSLLIEVELLRATRRRAPQSEARALEVLSGVGVVAVSHSVIARAAGYKNPDLRSLDAIHLATAEHVVDVSGETLEALVAYDDRLLAAAQQVGLRVVAPGMD